MSNKKKEIKNIYPLSPMQMTMLFHSIKAGDEEIDVYFRQYVITAKGNLDFDIFKKSLECVVKRHDILRSIFIYEKLKESVQVVFKDGYIPIEYIDISSLSDQRKELHIEEFKKKDKKRGFNLFKNTPLRMAVIKYREDDYKIIISIHHILMDGWCMGNLLGELVHIYDALVKKLPLNLNKVHPYSNYIMWIQNQDKAEAKRYWNEYLSGYDLLASVPNGNSNKEDRYFLKETFFTIDKEIKLELDRLARNNRVTVSTLMHVLWGYILQKYNKTNDVVFGTIVSGRPSEVEGVESMLGLFINTVPVRIKNQGDKDFVGVVKEVQEAIFMANNYSYLLLTDILVGTRLKQGILDHIIAYENYPAKNAYSSSDFIVSGIDIKGEQTNYDFNIIFMPGEEIKIKFSYNANVYSEDSIEIIKKHIREVAKKLIHNPEGLFFDKILGQRLHDEIWKNIKKTELLNIVDEDLIFVQAPRIDYGDFEF